MLKKTVAPALLGAALALHLSAAAADPVADFYKDKQIKIIIGNAAGGDYDIGGRILARHIGNHIPGNPTVVVQNMPGASTVTATNYLWAKAPKDGTVIGSFSRNIASQAVIGKMNIEADPRKFGWLGGSSLPSRVCTVSAKSGVKSPADLFTRAGEAVSASADANNSRSVFRYDGGTPRSLDVNRPFRMAASADGKVLAFGYAVHDFRGIEPKLTRRFFDAAPRGMVRT